MTGDGIWQKLKIALGPESRSWVRGIEGLLVLTMALGFAAALFILPLEIDRPLLQYALYGGIISFFIIAYTMFRESNLSRIERLAILVLLLCFGFSLMLAAVEFRQLT